MTLRIFNNDEISISDPHQVERFISNCAERILDEITKTINNTWSRSVKEHASVFLKNICMNSSIEFKGIESTL